jgi:hypothetical protein
LALVVLLAGISACGTSDTVLPTGVPPTAAVPTTEATPLPAAIPMPTSPVSAAAGLTGPVNLPHLVITAVPEDLPKYNRSNWNHRWIDADGDCQDTRAEVLIAESALDVSFGIDGQCTVDGGQWLTPFTSTVVEFARLLDIDHTVPLANAHRSGAREWSPQRKLDYFNDLSFDGHLIAVALSVTRSRGPAVRRSGNRPTLVTGVSTPSTG